MSRRARIIGYVIVAGVAARSGHAQDMRTLPARIDSARDRSETARRSLEAYQRTGAARQIRWTDSTMIAGGRVKVLFNGALAPYAGEGIAEAESQLRELGAFLERLPPLEFSIGPDSATAPVAGPMGNYIIVRHHPTPNTANSTSTTDDPEPIADVIVGKVTEVAVNRAGAELIHWSRFSLPLDARSKTRTDWGFVRLDVVSSKSFLGRRCHGGDLAACRLFLGFDPVTDPLTEYFDATGRRALIESERDNAIRVNAKGVQQCEAGDDGSCQAVLRLMSDWRRAPSSDYARRTLIARALVLGGELAPQRLLASAGSAGDALSAAARVPLDTLIMSWQRDMRDRAAASSNISLPIVVSSILSIGVCLFLALRSPRWR